MTHCKQCKSNNPNEYCIQSFCKILNNGSKSNNDECLSIMGCNSDFLQLWFEFQFDDKMNWRNYGSYWNLDHVKPRSLFNIEDDNDRRLMNIWFNLQPLEKYENMKKHNSYNNEIEHNHTTKILRFLDYLNKTNPNLCKFATESYGNLS